jgi:hypothetical protein
MRKLGLGDENGGEGARGPHARTHCPTLDFFFFYYFFLFLFIYYFKFFLFFFFLIVM